MNFEIAELLNAYRTGALQPTDVIREAYRRIAERAHEPIWIHLIPEGEAIARAEALGSFDEKLPLFGVPFAMKDNIDLAGVPTTAGCPAYAYTPEKSATVVEKLIAAGAIPLGKANLDQFATGLVGTRSPYGACSSVYDPAYISGGSSSGSAVAVAAGMVSFSLGTDTAGSGRVPAAFNNLIGVKPTCGAVSTTGVVPACRTLDCVSIFANTTADAAAVFAVAQGYDASDDYSRAPQQTKAWSPKFRFGVAPRELLEFFGDNEAGQLYGAAIDRLEAQGHAKVEIDFSIFRDAANLLYSGPWLAERYAAIRDFLVNHEDQLHPVTAKIITGAKNITAVDTFSSMYQLAHYQRLAESQWQQMDVLVLPTTGTIYRHEDVAAQPIALNTNLGYYTNFVNLLDLAAIAIPAGFRTNGLPFGISMIGPAWSDHALLQAAANFLQTPFTSPPTYCPAGYVPLAVCGAHLTGQPLNWQLTQAGAWLIEQTQTSADYKLYALQGTVPPKPGLVRVAADGAAIEVEVWAIPEATFGRFVANVPAPLAIGSCTLASGRSVKSFVCEGIATADAEDITHLGGWRAFVSRSKP